MGLVVVVLVVRLLIGGAVLALGVVVEREGEWVVLGRRALGDGRCKRFHQGIRVGVVVVVKVVVLSGGVEGCWVRA